jgi:hypothetical protein
MLKQPASGVLIIREAYLASMPPPILLRETNDASRTTDEADGLAGASCRGSSVACFPVFI